VAALIFAALIGMLPLAAAAAVAIGIPIVVLAAAVPRVCLVLVIFSIPFSSLTKVTFGTFDVTATDPLVALLIGGWLVRGALRDQIVVRIGPIIVAMIVLFCSQLLSTLTATSFSSSLKELIKTAEMIAVATYVLSNLDVREAPFMLLTLLAAGTVESLNGLRQFVTRSGPEFFAIGPFLRAYGDFGQPNALAGYLGMLLPFGIALALRPTGIWQRIAVVAMTGVIGAGILASLSRGAWLGTGIGLVVMAIVGSPRTRRALIGALGAVAGIVSLAAVGALPKDITDHITVLFDNFGVFDVRTVAVNPANFSVVERMAHWQAGWAMAMDHPLVGIGPGNFDDVYDRYSLPGWSESLGHAHNYFINTFAEMGIIGLFAFVGFLSIVFARLVHGLRLATEPLGTERLLLLAALGASIAFCVHNTFDNMFVHGIGLLFALILGLVELAVRELESDQVVHAHRN
jgi:O-antigen ligase